MYRVVKHSDIITIDPERRFGKPCIRDTRMTVFDVFEYLAGGMTHKELLAEFPRLTEDDLLACFDYVTDEKMVPRRPPNSVRLLFDEMLSDALPGLLADVYPGSAHILDVGLGGKADRMVWEHAREYDS